MSSIEPRPEVDQISDQLWPVMPEAIVAPAFSTCADEPSTVAQPLCGGLSPVEDMPELRLVEQAMQSWAMTLRLALLMAIDAIARRRRQHDA